MAALDGLFAEDGLVCAREVQFKPYSFRGRRSRNKVSVGEPAEGSLTHILTDACANKQTQRTILLSLEGLHREV